MLSRIRDNVLAKVSNPWREAIEEGIGRITNLLEERFQSLEGGY